MNLKKLGKALLFPHPAVRILLTPIALVLLILAFTLWGSDSPLSIISYVISAYTLTVWCFKIPDIIAYFKDFRRTNKLLARWREDERFRTNVSLYTALGCNTAFGLFQLWLGIQHRSFWFYSLAGYYVLLALTRFALLRHSRHYQPGENLRDELKKYVASGYVFLFMNLTLSLMVFFMIYWNRTFNHHQITTIAMAAYTFTAFTVAIINLVKYRRNKSPILSAAKAISLAAASVSMLTLESTMLTTFGDGTMDPFTSKLLLALSGGAVAALLIFMALRMIIRGTALLKNLNGEVNNNER